MPSDTNQRCLSHCCSLLFIGKTSVPPFNFLLVSAPRKTHQTEEMQIIKVFESFGTGEQRLTKEQAGGRPNAELNHQDITMLEE